MCTSVSLDQQTFIHRSKADSGQSRGRVHRARKSGYGRVECPARDPGLLSLFDEINLAVSCLLLCQFTRHVHSFELLTLIKIYCFE